MEKIKYDVFISYSRKDYVDGNNTVIPGNVVSRIKDALTEAGISYWFDEEGLKYGQNFAEKIVTNIEASYVFLFLSSARSNNSKWTSKEIASADEFGKPIIPVRIDDTPYNKKVMFRISDLNYIEYFTNPEKGIHDTIESIKVYLEQIKAEELKMLEEENKKKELERQHKEELKRKKEDEEKRFIEEQKRLIESIKLECESLNNEEVKIELGRKNLLFKVDGVGDTSVRESLKKHIVESSPIRKKYYDEFLFQDKNQMEQSINKAKTEMGKKNSKTFHYMYSVIIILLLIVLGWKGCDNQQQSANGIAEDNIEAQEGSSVSGLLQDSISVVLKRLSAVHPKLKEYVDGFKKGESDATYNLGKCFESGDFLEGQRNLKIAGQLVHIAANMGSADAQNTLGFYFFHGRAGYACNYDSSTTWYKEAIKNGSLDAEYNLALAYADGRYKGKKQEAKKTEEALNLYKKSAEKGFSKSQLALGLYYYSINKFVDAKKWFEKSLQGNLPSYEESKAQFMMGQLYGTGKTGITTDNKTAFEWYMKSATNGEGYLEALYYVGVCYQNGRGVQKDLVKAKEWYSKAANRKHKQAKAKLSGL